MKLLDENITTIKKKIAAAARLTGRSAEEIRLVIVTKNVPAWAINYVLKAGYNCFGENRAQELLAKAPYVSATDRKPNWHFIGRLQKNKVKKVVGLVDLIQSVDKLELALEINRQAEKLGLVQKVLVQVNAARDREKAGVSLEECASLVAKISKLRHIKVVGLMTIGRLAANPEENRAAFASLKVEFDKLKADYGFLWLSMGMSQDFQIAIQEGANMIRIGSAIFSGRRYL